MGITAMRAQAQAMMLDAVDLVTTTFATDAESNRTPSGESVVSTFGNFQHLNSAELRAMADRLESSVGYKLYLPYDQAGRTFDAIRVNGKPFQFLGCMAEGVQATYLKAILRDIGGAASQTTGYPAVYTLTY